MKGAAKQFHSELLASATTLPKNAELVSQKIEKDCLRFPDMIMETQMFSARFYVLPFGFSPSSFAKGDLIRGVVYKNMFPERLQFP